MSEHERPIRLPPKDVSLRKTTRFLIDHDVGKNTRFFVSSTSLLDHVKASLTSPDGQTHENPLLDEDVKSLMFYFLEATPGDWTLKLETKKEQRHRRTIENFEATTFVTTFPRNNDSVPVVLESSLSNNTLTDKIPVTITAHVYKGNDPIIKALVSATLTSPLGRTINISLLDNGAGTDALKDDGIYSRSVSSLVEEGRWQIKVTASSNSVTCKRPREELDIFYMSAGELNREMSNCTYVSNPSE